MLESLHDLGARIRHSRWLRNQGWLWNTVEPSWQRTFARLSRRRGFTTHVNGDLFKLTYAHGSRYNRWDKRAYEPVFYQAFTQTISEGMTVLDIGAHVGFFTLAAAARVGSRGRVYAFEPSDAAAGVLRRHIELNGWSDRVEVVQAVVSDSDGIVPFYSHGLSMSASLGRENVEVLSPQKFDSPAHRTEVASVSLDRFCRDRGIEPDVMKIDVEGAELLVLRGVRDLLLHGKIAVLCEIHPRQMEYCGSSLTDLKRYLDSIGYDLKPFDEPDWQGIYHSRIVRQPSE